MIRVTVIPRARVSRVTFWHVANFVCQHVLLHIPSGGKASVTNVTSEWALLCVAAVVDVEGTLAGKCFEADVACCAHFSWTAKWRLGWNTMTKHLKVQQTQVHALYHFFSTLVIFC